MTLDLLNSNYFTAGIQIALINLIALVSPGPDFAIVIRNSLIHSQKTGMMTSLGIICGEIVHMSYILLGVGFIVAKNIWILNTVKILGCIYLFYLGIKMIRVKRADFELHFSETQSKPYFSPTTGFKMGFIVNLFNPKAILFFIGLFSIVVDLNTPMSILLIYALVIILSSLFWFTVIVGIFSHPYIRALFLKVQHWIERLTGGILILLSIKLAITKEL